MRLVIMVLGLGFGACHAADDVPRFRILGPALWVWGILATPELGPAHRAAANRWLNDELGDSLRDSVVAAFDRSVFGVAPSATGRRGVGLKIILDDRDFTITPTRRPGYALGPMSLIVGARAYLNLSDGREYGPVPLKFVAFRDVPEPAFGPGVLVGVGAEDALGRRVGGDPAHAARTFLEEFVARGAPCAELLGGADSAST